MDELTPFERVLEARLARAVAQAAEREFDPQRIAGSAMGARSVRDRLLLRLGLGGALPVTATQRQLTYVLIVATLALAAVALAVGMTQPRGGELALVLTNGDVVIANGDGSGRRVVGHLMRSPLRNEVRWAPDGDHLAFFGDDWVLSVVDRNGRTTFEKVLQDRASQFAWSPDAQHLAIFDGAWLPNHEVGGPPRIKPELSLVAPDGTLDWAVPLPEDFRYVMGMGDVAWSPDGSRLSITGYRDGLEDRSFPSSIWIVDTATRTVRELRSGEIETDEYRPRWLPDGQILFSRLDSGLVVIDPETGVELTVYYAPRPCCGSTITSVLEPSPDGMRVVFVDPEVGPAILDRATGAVTPLRFGPGGIPPYLEANGPTIAWSSDGGALFARWGELPEPPGEYAATSVARFDLATRELTILASDVLAFDLRR